MMFPKILLAFLVGVAPHAAHGATLTGFPFASETLNYSINWPTGLGLGEAHLTAAHASGTAWSFEFTLDAAVPGFAIRDLYRAAASTDLCSSAFTRTSSHGSKKSDENTTVKNGTATRETVGGGESNIPVPGCVRDALTFLFYTRRELGQGRVPSSQTILFGSAYQARLDYAGAPNITIGNSTAPADRLTGTITSVKNPGASPVHFEVFFARDPARTPLLVKVPLTLGTFSMELVR